MTTSAEARAAFERGCGASEGPTAGGRAYRSRRRRAAIEFARRTTRSRTSISISRASAGPADAAFALARREALRAVALEDVPDSAVPRLSQFVHDWDWRGARREFLRYARSRSRMPNPRSRRMRASCRRGRADRAIARSIARRRSAPDPRSWCLGVGADCIARDATTRRWRRPGSRPETAHAGVGRGSRVALAADNVVAAGARAQPRARSAATSTRGRGVGFVRAPRRRRADDRRAAAVPPGRTLTRGRRARAASRG